MTLFNCTYMNVITFDDIYVIFVAPQTKINESSNHHHAGANFYMSIRI